MRLHALAVSLSLGWTFGCGEHTPLTNCIPGLQVTCVCPGGTDGTQRCENDGTFGACACEDFAPVDGGAPPRAAADGGAKIGAGSGGKRAADSGHGGNGAAGAAGRSGGAGTTSAGHSGSAGTTSAGHGGRGTAGGDAGARSGGTGGDETAGSAGEDPAVSPFTITKIRMETYYFTSYSAELGLQVMDSGKTYELDNGESWESGAGSANYGRMHFAYLVRDGRSLSYHMMPDARLLERIDYDSGSHSAHFRLDSVDELVLVAEHGGATATLEGRARIALDEPANYNDARFNHLNAPVGTIVPFTATYTLMEPATFGPDTFDAPFTYSAAIVVDLSDPNAWE
jgi:hypothetical protein